MLLDADELLALPVLGQRVARSAASTPVGRPGERSGLGLYGRKFHFPNLSPVYLLQCENKPSDPRKDHRHLANWVWWRLYYYSMPRLGDAVPRASS